LNDIVSRTTIYTWIRKLDYTYSPRKKKDSLFTGMKNKRKNARDVLKKGLPMRFISQYGYKSKQKNSRIFKRKEYLQNP
jgi:hypothetical protein